ncbi:GON domain-containing protein [Actinomadura sp. WMMA1423]|uniref:GON domain-containing protein n=1 Tax=Actinomadura sp. WMMA1423 TaxID=2591108 RepID=UPI001146C692|nr:GON domain-containing protein [Actinomadura sp. WMMA1423]
MAKIPFRTSVVLAAACAALPLAGTMPAHAQPPVIYRSCQQIRQNIPNAPNGTYLLHNGTKLFTVYCADMATAPKEYITLGKTGPSVNYSQYTAGGASPGTNVRTRFTRLRLDPATFTVDIGDLKYASSTGSLQHSGTTTVTSMPYAVAMSCNNSPSGRANIDLRKTAVKVNNTFATSGSNASGTAAVSPGAQVVNLQGGGFCGWIMPTPVAFNPFNPSPGMLNLTLDCADQPQVAGGLCFVLAPSNGPLVTRKGDRLLVRPRQGGRPVAELGLDGRIRSIRSVSTAS